MKAPAMFVLGAAYASTWWAFAMWPTHIRPDGAGGTVETSCLIILPILGTLAVVGAALWYCVEKWDA